MNYCFVIMPFSETSEEHTEEYWTEHFESFLTPLINECGNFNVIRSRPLRGDILKEIIESLVYLPLVVADLTDHNPNVFWELGVRQSFKHGTITIAKNGTKIPFDLGKKGVLSYYPKDPSKNEKFRSLFKDAIKDWLSNPNFPDSFVLEIVGRDIYENSRKELLRHTSLIKSYFRHLTDPVRAEDSFFHIQIEVDTVKLYLGQFYQFCHESVRKNIDELSDKGTIIEGFSIEQLLKFRSSIFHWMSLVNDPRLNSISSEVNLDFSLIEF